MQRNKCLHSLGGARGARNYLKFTALAASTIALVKVGNPLDVSLVTSLNGAPWQAYTTGNTISLNEGDEIRWRAATVNSRMADSQNNYHNFVMTGKVAASGVVMSLLDSTLHSKVLLGNNTLNSLFKNCTSLVSAPSLGFSRVVGSQSMAYTFQGCTSLVNVPTFEITEFGYQTCFYTFQGCTALVNTPTINASTNTGCCQGMFQGCTALVDASSITLHGITYGYEFYRMFQGCTALVNTPTIDVSYSSVSAVYEGMFQGCTSLVDASSLIIREHNGTIREMFQGCTALVNTPTIELDGVTYYGCYEVFKGCTSLVNASRIKISGDFNNNALSGMFESCAKLKIEPQLSMYNAIGNSIFSRTFRFCELLEEVTLDFPATTSTQWQSNTFQYCLTNCNAITDITITWEVWPDSAMVSNMFSWPNKSGVTLHVKPTLDISSLSTYNIPASWVVVQDA